MATGWRKLLPHLRVLPDEEHVEDASLTFDTESDVAF